MSSHRATPARQAPRRRAGSHRAAPTPGRSGRRLAAGSVAMVAAVAVLSGGQGSLAFWTDKATVTSGSLSAGRLDLTVDGAQGVTPPYTATTLTMASMVPGESVAATVAVGNAGDAPFTWVPTVTTGGGLGPALTVQLFVGATASNTSAYPRTGSCNGGTAITSGTTATRLNTGSTTQNLCLVVSLPAATGTAYQNATGGTVTVALAASQVLP